MFDLLKEKKCSCCGKITTKTIRYVDYEICSEECMIELFKNVSDEELLELDKKDREINKDFYEWLEESNSYPIYLIVIILSIVTLMTIEDILNKNLIELFLDLIVIYANTWRLAFELREKKIK